MNSAALTLGRTAMGQEVVLDPFAAQHTVIAGRTRSGKSVLLYSLLAQMRDLPVKVCGIDPTGVLFAALGDSPGKELRGLTVRDPASLLKIVQDLLEIMDSRIEQLLKSGTDKFSEFSSEFPLMVLVFEEYPGLLAALKSHDAAVGAKVTERVEPKVRAAIQRFGLEGAKCGFRLILLSQTPSAELLTGVLRSQLTQRVAMALDGDGLRMIFPEITPELIEASMNFIPGQGIIELPGRLPMSQFRADFIDYDRLVSHFSNR